MPRQLWIADWLDEWGLDVVAHQGWETRGSSDFEPRGVVVHHTAGPRGLDAPSLPVVLDGRPDLAPPLCHVLIARSGRCHVIAGGRANHAGAGGWRGLVGNRSVFGIEAENDGVGEPWPRHQLDVFIAASAALLAGIGVWIDMLCGHKEWTPRKPDPVGIDMPAFRGDVARALSAGPPTPPKETLMPDLSPTLVSDLQKAINAIGGDTPIPPLLVDGKLGPKTLAGATHAARSAKLRGDMITQLEAQVSELEDQLAECRAGNVPPDDVPETVIGRLVVDVVRRAVDLA